MIFHHIIDMGLNMKIKTKLNKRKKNIIDSKIKYDSIQMRNITFTRSSASYHTKLMTK